MPLDQPPLPAPLHTSGHGFERKAEVLTRLPGRDATARRAVEKPAVDQEGFDHVFESSLVLAYRGGEGFETNGAPVKLFDQRHQVAAIEAVEAFFVDVESFEGVSGPRIIDFRTDTLVDFGEVANPSQQPVRNAGRTP